MRRAIRRIDPKRAALLLIAAALVLAVIPFNRLHAQDMWHLFAPSGLSATATDTRLTLSWDTVTHATGYEVKLGASGATATVSSGTSHTFTGLAAGTSYTLYVRAKKDRDLPAGVVMDFFSAWSSISVATLLAAAPSGLSATATSASLTLSWTAVSGATSYEVKLGADGATTTVSSGTSHTFSGLTAGTSYTLYVRAKNSDNVSDWSSLSAATTLAAPSGLSATATSASLTLSWTAVTGATSYEVKQGASGAATTVSSGTSHTFSGLTANTSYMLYARARNSGGTSAWSSLTAITAPAAPSGLSAAATSASLTLSWTAVSGATSYEVKRGASGAATTVSSGTSHSFSGLSAGANYTLYARAKNSGGASDWSSLTAITAPATPDASLLRLYTDHTNVGLEWWRTRVTGATSYEVKLGPRGAVTTPSAPPHGHLFTGLWTVGEEYTLYVRARNSGGASDWAWATIDGRNPPLALTGLSATATSTSLTLSWTSAPSNKTTYEVKLGASGTVATVAATGHTFTTRGTGDKVASELSHTFTSLAGSTEYTLYVRAKNSGGTSPWSSTSATTSLAAPSGLSVATTLSSLTLSWNSVTGATSYEVKQGAGGAATAVLSGTSHTFTGLTGGIEYTLYVRAKNSDEASEWSSLSATTSLTAPSNLSVTAAFPSLTLSWDSVSGATSYEVKQGASGAVIAVSSGTSHTFSLIEGRRYTLYVRARSSGETSPWSSVSAITKLAPPARLTATPGIYRLVLAWNPVSTAASGYEVKQGANGTVISLGGADRSSYTVAGLTPGTEYTLYLRAKGYSGAVSDWVSTSGTPLPELVVPWLSVTPGAGSLTLSWYRVDGAVGYEVKQGASGAVTAVEANRTSYSYTVTGLTPGTEYTLYVRAKGSSGAVSDWVSTSGTPLAAGAAEPEFEVIVETETLVLPPR